MQARRTGTIAAVLAALLVPLAAQAQSTTSGRDSASAARAEALANVQLNRSAVIAEILERWRSEFAAASAARNNDGGEAQFAGMLQSASAEKLLAASQAQSYADAVASVRPNRGPEVMRLEPGSPIPHVLGDTGDDLVFTPITPCRIVDTRVATGGWAGKVGPNSGNWYSVNLADFTAQGGAASCPGMPTSFNPGAVAINITSTGQTGAGNLRVIACGAGTPTVSLLNYTPGVNLANAAVVASAVGTCSLGPPAGAGPNDIFVYSGNSASDVVIDLMGYFAPPVATLVDNDTLVNQQSIAASTSFSVASPTCPAGFRLTGGGYLTSSFGGATFVGARPVTGGGTSIVSGVNVADSYMCQGTTAASAQTISCFAICSRVPGR